MGVIRRSILIDEPSNEDHFNGKGHERTAVALSKAIANFSGSDRAIGLDGPWGSGKSTVVEIARKILDQRKTKQNRAYHFFTFDIWQSQGSSFRRSLLEHFLDWAIATFPKHRSQLQEVERKVKGKVREVRSTNQSILDWWGVLVIAALPFLPLYYFWAKYQFDKSVVKADFFWSGSFKLLVFFVAGTFLWALRKTFCEWRKSGAGLKGLLGKYRTALSQTLLIGSKQFEDQRVTQYIREIDPNDFEFQTTLREILSIVQSEKVRVVVVLDNIDRLPKKELNDYWAQVRAVFSGSSSVQKNNPSQSVTVIVPYHRHLIEEQEATGSEKKERLTLSPLGAREIFTKTFDEILQVSPPVMSNSREFFIEKMGEALPDVSDRDELFRVYLVFDRIIRHRSGSATPRQIIGFINELAGMYVLHGGRFKLPTVAVYIAYQDALEENPGLLNNPDSIEPRVRQIADDNELEQNLSAMIFNVEPELALQLMLDQRIKDAAVHSAEKLIEISNSAGFDVRVDQVVQENADEWDESGELPNSVSNFAGLSKVYNGDAKPHFQKSLVASVMRMRRFSFDPQDYGRLLAVIEIAHPDQLPVLVRSLIATSHGSQNDKKILQIEDGIRWVSFLGNLHRKLTSEASNNLLPRELGKFAISSDPRFLFGFAAHAAKEGVRLSWLSQARIDFGGENSLYPTYAAERPAEMRAAFPELLSLNLINDELKVSIFSYLVEQLEAPEVGDMVKFREQLELAAEVYSVVPHNMRKDLNAEKIFATSQFFEHLTESMESESDAVFGSALFLAMQSPGQMSLPVPTKQARNGVLVPDETEFFTAFSNALTAGEGVSSEQLDRIADLHKKAIVFTTLINTGASRTENRLTNEVIKRGFENGDLPWINLQTLNRHYDFLQRLLGASMAGVLARFEERISDYDIPKLELSEYSVALIRDARELRTSRWTKVREHLTKQLQAVPVMDWPEHLSEADGLSNVFLEMIEGSSFRVADPKFRDVMVQMLLDILSGRFTPPGTLQLDLLISAIDPSFHRDMYRQIRESAKDVTPTNLSVAVLHFPNTISHVIRSWEQLRKPEKDALVRFFLCSALEGGINRVLNDFEALGHTKVKEMIASSQESTREKLHGAMTAFSEPFDRRNRARQLGELFYGKRKVKGFLDIWFRTDSG
ncbi:P-loop NTPase fold protein [Agrobacterium fabrum]|uniref:KAP family P-loop domain-containing protein n=1 Tax=Agrobacterium fabrum TaxID=1176649 RepID=A0A7Z7BHH8_9HYPH|nr:P-loop NTPase fold protein [Agrobacterium fabrum]WIE26224.1 P-loop NTPase fold protein [Agrobacterium fabrum]WIE42181.1 P-loop NTPase fold protein [Agrobacterium fabrum]SDJ24333.1 KAP family P-loop domain-containing protein [Agrobacterium fabrum]